MLNSHPEITCYGALFLPEGRGQQPVGAQMPYFYDLMKQKEAHRISYLARGWSFVNSVFRNDRGGSAVGFKLMYSQFKYVPWLLVYLSIKRVRIVHLIRHNKLDHVISSTSARARGQFHQWAETRMENPAVWLDPNRILDQIRWEERKIERARRILKALRLPVLEITYEELVEDGSRYREILQFLEVSSDIGHLQTSLRKWNKRGYSEAIENYDELRRALQGTPYESLLDSA